MADIPRGDDFQDSTLSGSTVDTCSASVYEAFWTFLTRFLREGGLGSDPREGPDDLRRGILPHFSAFFALRPHGRECPFFSPR